MRSDFFSQIQLENPIRIVTRKSISKNQLKIYLGI